jgi:hypothetical protein
MKRSMIFIKSSKSMKQSCLTSTQEHENGGIVIQTSDNQALLVFSF